MNILRRTISGIASPGVVLIILFLLYVSFPTGFSTTDAWYSAATVKHSGALGHPFHLLYNYLGWIFSLIPVKLGFDVLSTLKVMNSLFVIVALLALQRIVRTINMGSLEVTIITFVAGSSFAVMRFSTENETYIVPLAFALLSSLYYLKYSFSARRKYAVLSGLMVSLAVLFHLSYSIWWLVIFSGFIRPFKAGNMISFLVVSLIIPILYILVILDVSSDINLKSISRFFAEYTAGNVSFGLSVKGILLSIINLFRSFLQVHGYMLIMIKDNHFMVLPAVVSLIIFLLSFFHLPDIRSLRLIPSFTKMHLFILFLNLLFAIFSFGNAEFMVMIPCIAFLLMLILTVNYEKFFLRLAAAMFIWNISFGLLPMASVSNYSARFLAEKSNDPQNLIVASDDQLLLSVKYYDTGIPGGPDVLKSPSVYIAKGMDLMDLENRIDSALSAGKTVYTDCIGEKPLSRATIIGGSSDMKFFSSYEYVTEKEWHTIRGPEVVSRITGRVSRTD